MKLITIILLVCGVSFAQTLIRGKIYDRQSNLPLPSANIYIDGTYTGTISNEEGHYALNLPEIPAIIIIDYIGYRTRLIHVTETGMHILDIALEPIILETGSIVVRAESEDPAVEIMRRVIKNKNTRKNSLYSYRAKAYTRLKVENDSSIVSLSESISNILWSSDKGLAEDFVAKKSSKRMPYLTEMEVGSKNIINLYEDNIPFFNHQFIGPTHPKAFDYYDFKLTNEILRDSLLVFQIKVTPKSKFQPLFQGRISVLDSAYAMIEADLSTSKYIHFSEMIESFKANYRQHFSNFGKDFWLLTYSRGRQEIIVNMGLLVFPKAIFEKVSRISDYQINTDVTNDFARLDTSQVSFKELRTNKSAFKNFEKIPLTSEEREAYRNPDTTMTLIKSFPPTGLLAGYLKSKEKDLEIALRSNDNYTPLNSGGNFGFQGWLNRVEGFNMTLKYNYRYKFKYLIGLSAGYRTALRNFCYSAEFKYQINKNNRNTYLFFSHSDNTERHYNSGHYNQVFTSLLPLFGFSDYFDYYRDKTVKGGFHLAIPEYKSDFLIELRGSHHLPLIKHTDCNYLDKSFRQPNNPEIEKGKLNAIIFRFNYDINYFLPSEAKLGDLPEYDQVDVHIEHSSAKLLKSNFDFTKISFLADYTLPTFFKRRPDRNYLRLRLTGSTYAGELPLQRYSIIDGSIFSYAPFGVFKTRTNKALEGEKKLAFFYEYNFKSILFEALGLSYFARNKYEFLIHGAGGRTWIKKSRLHHFTIFYADDMHHEFGLGLKLKYKFVSVRLDATRNLLTRNDYLGFNIKFIGLSF